MDYIEIFSCQLNSTKPYLCISLLFNNA